MSPTNGSPASRTGTALAALLALAVAAAPAAGYAETDRHDASASTHQHLMDLIPGILEGDGHAALAALLRAGWLWHLKEGTIAADGTLLMSREHYMSPSTHEGLLGFLSAGDKAEEQFALAQAAWAQGDRNRSLMHLGWSMHMVQDLTVPHHARLTFLDAHAEYESWVLANQGTIAAPGGGIYGFAALPGHHGDPARPWDWVDHAAHASHGLFPAVDGPDGTGDNDYRSVAEQMLPLAARLSAGFLYRMLERLDAGPPIAHGGPDHVVPVGTDVRLDGSASRDDVAIARIGWDLPGGAHVPGPSLTFRPDDLGAHAVDLVVEDPFGRTSVDRVLVTAVAPPGPPPRLDLPGSVEARVGGRVDLRAAFSDGSEPASVEWRFLGVVRTGAAFSESFGTPGLVTVRVLARTADGTAVEGRVVVAVRDEGPPVPRILAPDPIRPGRPAEFDASGSTDDSGIVRYRWWFGDGAKAEGVRVAHRFGEGDHLVTLEVSDGDGNLARTSLWVTVAPEAVPTGGAYLDPLLALPALVLALVVSVVASLARRASRRRPPRDG